MKIECKIKANRNNISALSLYAPALAWTYNEIALLKAFYNLIFCPAAAAFSLFLKLLFRFVSNKSALERKRHCFNVLSARFIWILLCCYIASGRKAISGIKTADCEHARRHFTLGLLKQTMRFSQRRFGSSWAVQLSQQLFEIRLNATNPQRALSSLNCLPQTLRDFPLTSWRARSFSTALTQSLKESLCDWRQRWLRRCIRWTKVRL